MTTDRARAINISVKVALMGFLAVGLVFPDWPQFAGKGWPARCVAYPIPALVGPVWHWARGRRPGYNHLADALLVTPFLLDIAGNVFNLYNTVSHFDDVLHFTNWIFLVAGFCVLVGDRVDAPVIVTLGVGFGAFAIVLWEIMEYVVMQTGSAGLMLTYEDTISDLALSTGGGALGAVLVWWLRTDSGGADGVSG